MLIDHVFVVTEPGAPAADRLVEQGLIESHSRHHPGQGTSNRVFRFENMALEFLWIHDEEEAGSGPAKGLGLVERRCSRDASPFGLVLRGAGPKGDTLPFDGWPYQPDYFPAPMSFHIGDNAGIREEPLCIFVPFELPAAATSVVNPGTVTGLRVSTSQPLSAPLHTVAGITGVTLFQSPAPLMELALANTASPLAVDLRPACPVQLQSSR